MTSEKQPPNILVTRLFPDLAVTLLKKAGLSVTAWEHDRPMRPEELLSEAKKCNALLCASSDSIDTDFLKTCAHLDIISQYAAGYDNIDIAQASSLGIPIGYTPGAMSEATADVAFGLMIATARKMFYMHKGIGQGRWTYFRPKANLGIELKNKTLGIFGLGRIGMAMARRCKGAYDMKVLYHNRMPNMEAEAELGARLVTFEKLLAESDVLSVHCALNDKTRGIFNSNAFAKMKSSALFINTARGGVHIEEDLRAALLAGEIWGAGLDVTNPEPMLPGNPLLEMENVAILPHIGSATVEARNAMARMAAENIIAYYKQGELPFCVNPEVLG